MTSRLKFGAKICSKNYEEQDQKKRLKHVIWLWVGWMIEKISPKPRLKFSGSYKKIVIKNA